MMDLEIKFPTQAFRAGQRWGRRGFITFSAALVVGAFAVVGASFYAFENWRGQRAWSEYKQQLGARSQELDWTAVVPPEIPDDKNFAAAPFLQLIVRRPNEVPQVEQLWPKDFQRASEQYTRVRPQKKTGGGPERHVTDLAAWQAAFTQAKLGEVSELPEEVDMNPAVRAKAATAVLEFLQVYEPVLAELRQASGRPGARFDIDYEVENPTMILLPHLARIKEMVRLLQLRASAELALGQSDKACQDTQLMLRLCEALKDEPTLISYLVEIASFRIATDLIWEGLALHKWTDKQCQELQAHLQKFDFLAGLENSFRAERAMALKFIEYLRTNPRGSEALEGIMGMDGNNRGMGQKGLESFFSAMPDGWLYLEQCNYAQMFPMPLDAAKTRRVDPARWLEREQEMEQLLKRGSPVQRIFQHRMLSALLLPALSKTQMRGAEAQTVADEAVIACALERYRLANGNFPDQLQALVPRFVEKVTQDVISGEPLIYRRTEGGQFVLYSVAWNGRDDGGVVAVNQSPGNATRNVQDWVWHSQTKN